MKKDLGKIKQVELRDAWALEPEFTRWLAEEKNLDALSNELGLELSLIQTEANVGDFNVDILAEEAGTSMKVIIENQLEITNHDHLGKLITYASGHDAKYVIWIFKDVREEHRQAIDWLNEHTTDDLNFFAIKLELWQIGDSMPAPKFDVICRPNEWAKTVKKQSSQGQPSEGKLRQFEFWTLFRAHVQEKKVDIQPQAPRAQHWTNISIGSSQAHVALTMNTQKGHLGCELYISKNKPLFEYLKTKKTEIENELGVTLEWIEASKATRILETTMGFNIDNDTNYTTNFDWLLTRALAFKKTFADRIKDFQQSL